MILQKSIHNCFCIITSLNGEQKAYEVAHALERIEPEPVGVATIEIDESAALWEVSAYFTTHPDTVAVALIEATFNLTPFRASQLPDIDWVAKVNRDLVPVQAGSFWVYMNQDQSEAPHDSIPINIVSSMAFGTGHHGTTKGCLEMLENVAADFPDLQSIVDIGCGTGILSMASSHLWGGRILASDNDDVAVEVTIENIKANRLEDRIKCTVAEGFGHSYHLEMVPIDLVVANILLNPLVSLAPEIYANLSNNGLAVLSGIMINQEQKLTASYTAIGFRVKDRITIEDWVTLLLVKE